MAVLRLHERHKLFADVPAVDEASLETAQKPWRRKYSEGA